MRDWGEMVAFDPAVLESPPASSHYTVWIHGRESEPLSVYFDPADYIHTPCRACMEEKCWLAEPSCLVEFTSTHPNMVYEHACCCACHESVPNDDENEDDDYGDWDSEDDDPSYKPTQAA